MKIQVKVGSFQHIGMCDPSPFWAAPIMTLSLKVHVSSCPSIYSSIHPSIHPSIPGHQPLLHPGAAFALPSALPTLHRAGGCVR